MPGAPPGRPDPSCQTDPQVADKSTARPSGRMRKFAAPRRCSGSPVASSLLLETPGSRTRERPQRPAEGHVDIIRRTLQVTLVGAIAMVVPWTEARAEERAVGIVPTLEGAVTVARASLPQPAALKFKDQVFVRDRIVTGDSAVVRILLGGKATVTARERSVLVISEGPGTSTISLSYGQIAVAVVKSRMNPGESVEIRTPNAVAAVRGTVVIADVPVRADRSTITVLRGLVDVIRLTTAGRAIGPVTSVEAQ